MVSNPISWRREALACTSPTCARRDVLLELQLLQRDFVELALREVSGGHALAIELDHLGETLEILLGELQRRLGEQGVDERLLGLESELSLEVDHVPSR